MRKREPVYKLPVFWFLLILFMVVIGNWIHPKIDYVKQVTDEQVGDQAHSSGERILIKEDPWLSTITEPSPPKELCRENFKLKEKLNFEEFINSCPIDVETKIYLNNKKANKKAISNNNIIVKIAVVVPISSNGGMGVFESIEILTGAELAQSEINKNGIKVGDQNVFLEIVIVDDNYVKEGDQDNLDDIHKAQKVANYLGNNVEIVGVVGHFSSDGIEAAAGIYKEHKLVAISPTSTALRKSNSRRKFWLDSNRLKLNSYIFRTAPNDEIAVNGLIDYITVYNEKYNENQHTNKTGIQDVAIIYESKRFPILYQQQFKEKFLKTVTDGTIIDTKKKCELNLEDKLVKNRFENCFSSVKKHAPDAILLIPGSKNNLALVIQFLSTISLENKPILLGADSMYEEVFLKEEKATGMIVAVPLEERFFKDTEKKINWRSSMTYDATQAIIKGIDDSECEAGLNDINECLRKQIKTVLSSEKFKANGILGYDTVYFNNGDRDNSGLEKKLGVLLRVTKEQKEQEVYRFSLLD